LFLDEIGDMPRSMQAKFLRVLQDGEFRRVGGSRVLRTNARIVLATNRELAELIRAKDFREDLFYRIRGAQIHMPPLRDRREDIPVLARYFLHASAAVANKRIRGFLPETIARMQAYTWPGNVRELKHEVDRIVACADEEWVAPEDLEQQILTATGGHSVPAEQGDSLREMERRFILQRLESQNWNIQATARSLGLTRNGLYSKMKMYSIPRHPPGRGIAV
jgi:DNA-binding NtrC family response regulator